MSTEQFPTVYTVAHEACFSPGFHASLPLLHKFFGSTQFFRHNPFDRSGPGQTPTEEFAKAVPGTRSTRLRLRDGDRIAPCILASCLRTLSNPYQLVSAFFFPFTPLPNSRLP